ncbi:MAG: FKBP-type peptidyl-prolyl cis-trans isomerase [Chlamydiota bacterium]
MIENGKQVAIEYSVFSDDNTRIDSNVGKDPLIFLFGSHQILPALEEAIRELDVGDNKEIILDPRYTYGEINPDAFKKTAANSIPEDSRFEGALLIVTDEHFGELLIRVDRIEDQEVVLDFNHPLAGKTLKFDLKVLDIS